MTDTVHARNTRIPHNDRQKRKHCFRSISITCVSLADMISDFKSISTRNKLNMTDLYVTEKYSIHLRTGIVAVTADQVLDRLSGIIKRFKHFIGQKTPIVLVKGIYVYAVRHRNIKLTDTQTLCFNVQTQSEVTILITE